MHFTALSNMLNAKVLVSALEHQVSRVDAYDAVVDCECNVACASK